MTFLRVNCDDLILFCLGGANIELNHGAGDVRKGSDYRKQYCANYIGHSLVSNASISYRYNFSLCIGGNALNILSLL
jgi:hypothetical protein